MKLSSIIIAKNEEQNIRRCIESQLDCIDEIIVLIDSATTDATEEIVTSFRNVKYLKLSWQGYAETKKKGVILAEHDWILWIDADESITPALVEEIKNFKNTSPQFNAYTFPRKSFFLGRWIKHGGWYPGRVARLFNKKFINFSSNNVHEHLEIKGKTGEFRNDIEHYTDPNITHYFNKFNLYTSLAADDLFRSNKKFRMTDIILRPFLLFIKMYILKRGFLDGIQGFILAVFSSAYVFTKYCKLWELKRGN